MADELRKVLGGSIAPLEWMIKGRKPVAPYLALSRAGVCVTCPKNGVGPLSQWFTKRAADKIKKVIELRLKLKMTTLYDGALGVCEACYCPLPLKVHEPIDLVKKHLKTKVKKELWDRCWILKETSQPTETEEQ